MEFKHVSVLLNECIEGLAVKPDGIYVDGTLGGAGHAFHVCEKLSEKGQFIGIDQDEAAIRTSTERLQPFGDRAHLVRSNYVNVKQVVKELQIDKVDGILLDLGVSSYQLDTKERGFSYMADAPLDMRMDQSRDFTAKDLVNSYPEEKLYEIIKHLPAMKRVQNIPYISEELLKDMYSGIYQNEDISLFDRITNNPSSGGNPSSGSMSSRMF